MEIKIFAIGGNGECFVGTAHDAVTALSLIQLVEKNGGYAVSMHGNDGTSIPVSGEFLLNEARNLFKRIVKQVDEEILNDLGLEQA